MFLTFSFPNFVFYLFLSVISAAAVQEGALAELLKSCFDPWYLSANGHPEGATFTLKGEDDFRDVELTFVVNGDPNGFKCTLEWDAWLVPCGSIISTNKESGEAIENHPTSSVLGMSVLTTGIKMEIYGGNIPHWELTWLHPNNLCSGKFVRSFIVQGMQAHSHMLGGKHIFLRLCDISTIREQYWLEHTFKTYYQEVWNLEYECLLSRLTVMGIPQFWQRSAQARFSSAAPAFADTSFTPVRRAFSTTGPLSEFHRIFIFEIERYMETKSAEEKSSMRIREAIQEFIQFWKHNITYTAQDKQILSQNTFMFFFRHHPEFDSLARQVLLGYDDTCNLMTGVPKDATPRTFQFFYQHTSLRQPQQGSILSAGSPVGSPASAFGSRTLSRVSAPSFNFLKTPHFFLPFLFVSFLLCFSYSKRLLKTRFS